MRALPGRFGITPVFVTGKQLDAGITASNTVKIPVALPFRKCFLERLSVSAVTLPAGGAAITGTFKKYDASADAAVTLTAAVDLTSGNLVAQESKEVTILSTLTDSQRIFDEGDTLYLDATAAGTVTTQPAGLTPMAELSVLQ